MTENFRFSKTRQYETFYVIFKHNDYLLDFQDILQCVAKSTWHNFDESWVVGANSKSNMYSISHYWKCNYRVQTMYHLPPLLSYLVASHGSSHGNQNICALGIATLPLAFSVLSYCMFIDVFSWIWLLPCRTFSSKSAQNLGGSTHGVRKSHKKSHSTLRAKRATVTFWVGKSWPKMVNFDEF